MSWDTKLIITNIWLAVVFLSEGTVHIVAWIAFALWAVLTTWHTWKDASQPERHLR